MKGKKVITILLLILTGIWTFGYFAGYIKDLHGILFMFVGTSIWFLLGLIGVWQILILMIEKNKHYERIRFSCIIFMLLALTFYKPRGVIKWEIFEDKNYLVAVARGNILKLKPKNKLKFISSNQDFYFGTYQMKGDTLFLLTKKITPYMDRISYATLQKSGDENNSYSALCLYQNMETKHGRCITMFIRSLDIENLIK